MVKIFVILLSTILYQSQTLYKMENTMCISYQIEFFSYWHIGSGLSGGAAADNIVLKNDKKLPFIPGKTLKGLLREAAELINGLNGDMVSSHFINDVFGEKLVDKDNKRNEGEAFFANAYLTKNASDIIVKDGLTNELYQILSSTAIDENGQAVDSSLRQLEVTIPLTLYGKIEHFSIKPEYKVQLEYCFKWIKQMGQNRNRGLGKCKFSII